jgi:beta-galactosidase/beta-glucuronidase
VPATRIVELRWTPDVDTALLRLDVRLERADLRPLRLQVVLTQHGEVLVEDVIAVRGDRVSRDLPLAQTDMALGAPALLWSPETPNIIEAQIRLLDGDGIVDEVASYAAMRSISASEHRILLNGRPYFLRLVLDQGYWPESHLAAPEADALRREVELVRSLGFNGVRLHQRLADPRFLYWCDRLGLVVWAEMPAAYEFSPRMMERLTREWIEVLRGDHSHPCVIAWVPVNEKLGGAAAGAVARAAGLRPGALPPDQGAGPEPAGHRQRRVGADNLRRHHRARLQLAPRSPAAAVRRPPGRRRHTAPDAAGLPLGAAPRRGPGRGTGGGERVRWHEL